MKAAARVAASLEEAQTAATTVFEIGETFCLFNCRSLTRSMFSIGLSRTCRHSGGRR